MQRIYNPEYYRRRSVGEDLPRLSAVAPEAGPITTTTYDSSAMPEAGKDGWVLMTQKDGSQMLVRPFVPVTPAVPGTPATPRTPAAPGTPAASTTSNTMLYAGIAAAAAIGLYFLVRASK